jgi:protein phosphatase
MNPENIYYLFEAGTKVKQEDYIWPLAGKATLHDKIFIVCDGSGNFYGGEVASELICRFMAAKVLRFGEQKMSGELIDKLLIESRDRLVSYARDYRLDTDLATTFSMLILYDQRALVSWCGDSRIYHIRGGEILFRTNDNSLVSESSHYLSIGGGIKADSSPIYSETKWIEDVHDGDYFLLCSKGITDSISDEDIKLLVRRNDKENIDLTGSFKELAYEKAPDNYSMYLVKVNTGAQKRRTSNGATAFKKPANATATPMSILAITFVLFLIMVFYFRRSKTSNPVTVYTPQTTQHVEALHEDSVPSALVMSAPRKPATKVIDSPKSGIPTPAVVPQVTTPKEKAPEEASFQEDSPVNPEGEVKPEPIKEVPVVRKKREPQLLLKLTTDESCKLEIRNTDLDQVINWDLSPNDNGTIYLKQGKYLIVATSVDNGSKSKTFNFEVKPGSAQTTQILHIRF